MECVTLHVSYLNQDNKLSKSEEITLENHQTTDELLEKISDVFRISAEDYELYYGIKSVDCKSEKDISKLGIRSGCKLYAIQKKKPENIMIEKVEMSEVQNAIHGLHLMFHNAEKKRSRVKTPIARMFEDEETMLSIISSIEGLSADQTALDILENRKLFEILVHPKNSKAVLEKHPCLAAAIVTMWQSLTASSRYSNFGTSPSTSQGMEVEDNLLPPADDRPSSSNSTPAGSNRANIFTSTQLAAAIAQATSPGGAPTFNYSSYNTPSSSSIQSPMNVGSVNRSGDATPGDGAVAAGGQQNQSRPLITPDVFSQAMQQALMSTSQDVSDSVQTDSSGSAQSVSEDVMQAGLNQLHAMGITDDEASRQALAATHGNVEAAVDLLFSGN